jgi:hypothetical protein
MTRYIQDEANALHPVVSQTGRDDKAWAKRILYRDEHGDKTLMPIQVRLAKEALNVQAQGTA